MRYSICLLGAVFLVFSVSCGTSTPIRAGHHAESTVLLSGVPFYRQNDFQCGPAALATVVNYWNGRLGSGSPATPESIGKELYSPTAKGVLGIDLEIYAKKRGFSANQYSANVSDLRRLIDRKIPAIILVDFGIGMLQINHFVVITGYTPSGVLANTGREENELLTERRLDSIWKRTRYWTLVVKPLD